MKEMEMLEVQMFETDGRFSKDRILALHRRIRGLFFPVNLL